MNILTNNIIIFINKTFLKGSKSLFTNYSLNNELRNEIKRDSLRVKSELLIF